MAEFTVNGQQYRSEKLNAFQQFHVARRLAPLLTKAAPAFRAGADSLQDFAEQLSPLFDGLAHMSDEDTEYVLRMCMGVTRRQQGSQWVPVFNVHAQTFQFSDIDLPAMMQITVQVIQDNIGNFLQGIPTTSSESPSSLN